jgi:hypothetical protein
MLVHDGPEGATTASRLGLQPRSDIIIKRQCRSHVVMLWYEHHDV